MEVLVGPTLTIDVPTSPRHGHRRQTGDAVGERRAVPSRLFFKGVEDDGSVYRIGEPPEYFPGESSESSSSIGIPDDSDNDASYERDRNLCEEEEEVQSELKGGPGLVSLDCLEESLPVKRGLSSHFVGKSKSFTDLSQVSTVKELQKQESPFNKRRRVLIASKWSRRRSSFYSWSNPKSMPLLPVDENEDDENDGYEAEKARKVSPASSSSSSSLAEGKNPEDQVQNKLPESYAANVRVRLGSFKSRSFSLADLQEHEDEEEEVEEEEEEDDDDEHLT